MVNIAVNITSQTSFNDLMMKYSDVYMYIQENSTIYFAFFQFFLKTLVLIVIFWSSFEIVYSQVKSMYLN